MGWLRVHLDAQTKVVAANFRVWVIPITQQTEYKYGAVFDIESQFQLRVRRMIGPTTSETILPIQSLKANERASVVELVGDHLEVQRLAEMGLRTGVAIRMVRPGSPCLLALDGKRLSVRLASDVDVLVAVTA